MRRRGFTFVEVVVSLAILTIITAIGYVTLHRSTTKNYVREAARDMAQRIANARAIAETVGPRLRQLGPPALVTYAPPVGPDLPCPGIANGVVAVMIDPGAQLYVVPERVIYNPLTDGMQVACRTYRMPQETHLLGRLATNGGAAITIAFTGSGRVDVAAPTSAGALNWWYEIQSPNTDKQGYRVLQSGVVCRSSFSGQIDCNRDP